MMAPGNLTEIVRGRTPDDEVHLIPVIEKELLHYDVLAGLEKLGFLDRLVFHGGTCLRLCYGAERRSEDLDFAYSGDLDELDLGGLEDFVRSSIGKKFDLSVKVKPPRKTVELSHAEMQRWWMTVDTAPERPDLPSQKLKIEIVSVETFTREVRRIARNYDYLFPSAGNTLAVCESRDEILADKMVSFVDTQPNYIRNRDLWDMMFLLSQGECDRNAALSLVPKKLAIYGCDFDEGELSERGAQSSVEVGESEAFASSMLRFMKRETFDGLFGSQIKRDFALGEVRDLYRSLPGTGK